MARSLRVRNAIDSAGPSSPEPAVASGRPRRAAQQKTYREEDEDDIEDLEEEEESITLQQPIPQHPTSIKLKLKMPPSRLRESTTNTKPEESPAPSEPAREARPSRGRRQIISESDSDDDDDDAEGDDLDEEEDEEDDAEGESDIEMEDAPTPPVIKQTGSAARPKITISAPRTGVVKSVEAKEISMATGQDYDDDDLSDLSDNELDESIMEEDAIEGEEDAEGDSFDEDDLSRLGTPDLSKLTKRQRALHDTPADDHFMALNMGPQSRLALTDEQRNLRRVEMARRRKNLSEKRNEEEKQDTINRLLKKQAPKRRGKISAAEIIAGGDIPDVAMGGIELEVERPNPVFSRWVSGQGGIKLGIPGEWKDTTMGKTFGSTGWKIAEEVEV